MKKLNGEELKIGDIVKCKGITCEIASFGFNEPWEWRSSYYCEFTDTKGNYRSWKQCYDGGDAYRKDYLYALDMQISTDGDFGWDYGKFCPPTDMVYSGIPYVIYFDTQGEAFDALIYHIETVIKTFRTDRSWLSEIKNWYEDVLKNLKDKKLIYTQSEEDFLFCASESFGNPDVQYEIYKVEKKTVGNGFVYLRCDYK